MQPLPGSLSGSSAFRSTRRRATSPTIVSSGSRVWYNTRRGGAKMKKVVVTPKMIREKLGW